MRISPGHRAHGGFGGSRGNIEEAERLIEDLAKLDVRDQHALLVLKGRAIEMNHQYGSPF